MTTTVERAVRRKKTTDEKLVPAQGTRLRGSSHPCGDGVNDAQTSVLQREAQTAQLLLLTAAVAYRADYRRPLVGLSGGGICAASMIFTSMLLFFTGTQELLQLILCLVVL